jgi:hypothetical protein
MQTPAGTARRVWEGCHNIGLESARPKVPKRLRAAWNFTGGGPVIEQARSLYHMSETRKTKVAEGLRGRDSQQERLVDRRAGAYDPVNALGGRQPDQIEERRTAHQNAQHGADVRGEPIPPAASDDLPEGLARPPASPWNKSSGRAPPKND